MTSRIWIFLAAACIVSLLLSLINVYLGGIAFIILLALVMSLAIMRDVKTVPEIAVTLTDDARGLVLFNNGSAPARNIHIALVPLNIEFDLSSLAVEERKTLPVREMINEAKAAMTWENENGEKYSRTAHLSSLHPTEEDLLKPMFPLFR